MDKRLPGPAALVYCLVLERVSTQSLASPLACDDRVAERCYRWFGSVNRLPNAPRTEF